VSVHFNALVFNKPANITNLYDDINNGNCTSILGDLCTRYIMKAASEGSIIPLGPPGCDGTIAVSNDGGANAASVSVRTICSCFANYFEFSLTDYLFALDLSWDGAALERSDTLFYRTSQTCAAGNMTIFN
jgi:hypothetical protein